MKFLYIFALVALACFCYADDDQTGGGDDSTGGDGPSAPDAPEQPEAPTGFVASLGGLLGNLGNTFEGMTNGGPVKHFESESTKAFSELKTKNGEVKENKSGMERRRNVDGQETVQKQGDPIY